MCSRWPSSVKASAFFIAAFIVGSPNTHLMCMARPKSSPLPPQMSVIDQIAPCEMHGGEPVLVAARARRIIAAQRGAADRDARGVDVRSRAAASRCTCRPALPCRAVEDLVAAQRAALPRASRPSARKSRAAGSHAPA